LELRLHLRHAVLRRVRVLLDVRRHVHLGNQVKE
jgi:hypothetical protein